MGWLYCASWTFFSLLALLGMVEVNDFLGDSLDLGPKGFEPRCASVECCGMLWNFLLSFSFNTVINLRQIDGKVTPKCLPQLHFLGDLSHLATN